MPSRPCGCHHVIHTKGGFQHAVFGTIRSSLRGLVMDDGKGPHTVLEDRPRGVAWVVDGTLDSVLLTMADAKRHGQNRVYLNSYGVGMDFDVNHKWTIRELREGEDPAAI